MSQRIVIFSVMADAHGGRGGEQLDPKKRKLEQRLEKLSSQLKESLDELTKANKKAKNKKSREQLEGLGQSSSVTSTSGSRKPVAIYGFGDDEKRRLRNKKQREWYAARKEKCSGLTSAGKDSRNDDARSAGSDDDADADDAIIDEENYAPTTCVDEGMKRKNDFEGELALLMAECREILSSAYQRQDNPRTWKDRMESLEESWSERREELFEVALECETLSSSVCEMCGERDSLIECKDCEIWGLCLCEICDDEKHSCKPLHNRRSSTNGFLQSIAPTKLCQGMNEFTEKERYLNLKPRRCNFCNADINGASAYCDTVTEKCIVVTMKGRYDLLVPNLLCQHCGHSICTLTVRTVVENSFWPCSVENITSIIHVEVFEFWDTFQKLQPNSAESCFLRVLEDLSTDCGRASSINRRTFARAFKEWKYCRFEMEVLQKKDWMVCPPCHETQHSVHVDGNCKLKRFQRVGSGTSESYYAGQYIIPKADVEAHVTSIGSSNRVVAKDNTCGNSVWEAASNVARRKAQLDETGLYLSSCRHQVTQKSLNMYRGEIYAYPLLLQQHFLTRKPVLFFWQDVVCKYWPWLKHVNKEVAKAMTPALSVMHGKGHAWHCEVIYGGRWVEGTALANGEEVEQVNSYLSRAAHVTKRMLPENRDEFLTECAHSWNKRKVENMPNQLSKRYLRTKNSIEKLQKETIKICEDAHVTVDQIDFSKWKSDIQQIALAESSKKAEIELTDTEDYVINVAELLSVGQLPETIKSCVAGNLLKLAWESGMSSQCFSKNRSVDGKRDAALSFFRKLNLTEDNHRHLIQSSVSEIRFKIGKSFQREIDRSYLNIFQLSSNARRLTDSCKGFVKIMKRCKKEKEALKPKVDAYNSIAVDCSLTSVQFEEVCTGNMPWHDDQLTAGPTMKVKRSIVEKRLLIKRSEEELPLLVREMRDHVNYYKYQVLPQLEACEVKIFDKIQDISRWGIPGHSPQREIDSIHPRERGRYHTKAENMHVLNGIIAVIKKGKYFARKQIDIAASKYKKALENDAEVQSIFDVFEELDDDDNDNDDDDVDENHDSNPSFKITNSGYSAGDKHTFSEDIYRLEKTGDQDVEVLLLSEEYFSSCIAADNCNGVCIFQCLILGCFFLQCDYKIYHLYTRMKQLISQICEAVLEGERVHGFFSNGSTQFTVSASEAVTLLCECDLSCSITFETNVFLEHTDADKLLLFHLQRLLDLKRRYAVLYTCSGKASLFLLDGSTILFIDIHANSMDSVQAGAVIIRAKESLLSFLAEVAKARGIDPNVKGGIAVITTT